MSKPLNFLVFFTDQQRWDTTGVHGNPMELTPNFDRAARAGTHLARTFTCQPLCGPARSCLQTGKHATTTGCFSNGIPLPDGHKTLADYFNEAGYQTAYFGKWHLAGAVHGAVEESGRGGYRHWLAANALELVSDSYDYVVYDDDNREVRLPGYRVDAQTDSVIRFLDANRSQPFFLMTSYLEPHQQNSVDDFPPPDGYRERYTGGWIPPDLAALGGSTHKHLGGYYGQVKRLDEALGRIFDALKSLGILENTVVAFVSDHGCHFRTRAVEYKRTCHESSIRIPSFLTGGPFQGGGCFEQLVSLVDFPPTFLDAAGIPVPADMEGQSLLPLLNRREQPQWRDNVFIQVSAHEIGRAVRTRRWKYGVKAMEGDPGNDSRWDVYHEAYLYDLETDPYELENLAGAVGLRPVTDELKKILLRRIAEVEAHHPKIIDAPEIQSSREGPPPFRL